MMWRTILPSHTWSGITNCLNLQMKAWHNIPEDFNLHDMLCTCETVMRASPQFCHCYRLNKPQYYQCILYNTNSWIRYYNFVSRFKYMHYCIKCVFVSFVMRGCFGNMCTCIYCVLYCLYCFFLYCFIHVYLFLFVLSVLV
jgi:hypothetical protein